MALLGAGCTGSQPSSDRLDKPGGIHREPGLELGTPWTGWDDARPPFLDFDHPVTWRSSVDGVRLDRCADDFSGQTFAGRLSGPPAAAELALVTLTPPAPAIITDPFDTFEVWLGTNPGTHPPAASPARLAFVGRDGAERPLRLDAGEFPSSGWMLVHRRMEHDHARKVVLPVRITGAEVADWRGPAVCALYFRGPSVFTESRAPIVPAWRPGSGRKYRTPPDRILHGGGDPFEDADRDLSPASGMSTSAPARVIAGENPGVFRMGATRGPEGISFEISPAAFRDRGLDIRWGDRPAAHWEGFDLPPSPLVLDRIGPEEMRLEYEDGLALTLRAAGGVLVIDAVGRGRDLPGLSALPLSSAGGLRVIRPPFLPVPVFMWREADPTAVPLFATMLFEPRRSAASELRFMTREGTNVVPAAVRYAPATDGARLRLRERFVLSVSPDPEQVVPRPAPGPSAPCRLCAEAMPVRSEGDAEQRGAGMAALQRLGVRAIQVRVGRTGEGNGHASLLSPDDLAPGEPGWTRDALRQASDGQWIPGLAPNHFALKLPFLRLWLEREVAAGMWPRAPGVAYVADLTRASPWRFTDYDGRVPEAAAFRPAYDTCAQMMRRVTEAAGSPVLAHDATAWLYVGYAGGGWLSASSCDDIRRQPMLPLYASPLLGAHLPLAGLMAKRPPDARDREGLHRDLVLQSAYHLCPVISAAETNRGLICLQASVGRSLHAVMTTNRLLKTAWYDGRRLLSGADALAAGAWRRSHLYMRFSGEVECWLNGGTESWEVQVGSDRWRLPPGGWVALGPSMLALSVTHEGRRIDYLSDGSQLFFDGNGVAIPFRGISSEGPLWLRHDRTAAGMPFDIVIPAGGGTIRLPLGILGGHRISAARAETFEGEPLGSLPFAREADGFRLDIPAAAWRVTLVADGE